MDRAQDREVRLPETDIALSYDANAAKVGLMKYRVTDSQFFCFDMTASDKW